MPGNILSMGEDDNIRELVIVIVKVCVVDRWFMTLI
jgi:hypothetical protein